MKKLFLVFAIIAASFTSCDDFLTKESVTLITDNLVIVDAESAESVLLGLYGSLQGSLNSPSIAAGNYIFYSGVLSDELDHVGSFPQYRELEQSNAFPTNVNITNEWGDTYAGIYIANILLEKIETITFNDPNQKNIIKGQAKFVRAFQHFHLLNYFGGIPIATASSLSDLTSLSRSTVDQVNTFLISELTEAATLLNDVDYGTAGRDQEDRVRAGEWACKALLARVQLYKGDKAAASALAADIINNGGYSLPANYNSVFNGNSSETIFEVFYSVNDPSSIAFYFSDQGRYEFAPSAELITSFAAGDERLGVIRDAATTKPIVYKYKDVATGTDKPVIFRLAEMYLIRAEASLGTPQADSDVNLIRARADVSAKTGVTLDDILEERFVELCFEGHRWFDLKRTGKLDAVMSAINPNTWTVNKAILPIPFYEVAQNPNIQQNPSY